MENLEVIKFGGTSLSNSKLLKRAASIISQKSKQVKTIIVVSAMGGVTDHLITIIEQIQNNDPEWKTEVASLKERHVNTALELISSTNIKPLIDTFEILFNELDFNLGKLKKSHTLTDALKDHILSVGERLSCHLFSTLLTDSGSTARPFESQNLIRTNDRFGNANVDFKTTRELIHEKLLPLPNYIPVVTGYVGSTVDDQITTLGRSGSDYTAGIIGKILNANKVEIWTDVNGVFTTDPNKIPTALQISNLNYSEMAEMAHFGANVLHPSTVLPLEQLNIPIVIKNTFDPSAKGTLVTSKKENEYGLLRSVSIKNDLTLIGLKSYGLEKIPSLLTRALTRLHKNEMDVFFNASASSNLGFSLVVRSNHAKKAQEELVSEFTEEIEDKLLESPTTSSEISMITVIGNKLYRDNGLTSKILAVMADNKIVPMAYAKEVENRRFTFILPTDKAVPAIRLINDHFCISNNRVRLFIAGVGTIGGELLNLLNELKGSKVDYNIIGVCDSKHMIWNPLGIAPDKVDKELENGDPTDWSLIIDKLTSEFSYRTVFIDATGKLDVALQYKHLLESGVHIATPSKIANTQEQDYYDALKKLTVENNVHYKYETTVGAGLPVIQTLRDLIISGDEIEKITGALSGTMTYLFGELENGHSFSDTIIKARKMGYAEPDPRDDLSGEDVARKFITLARTSEYQIERNEINVESLVPEELTNVTRQEFIERIKDYDPVWEQRINEAKKENKVLRYIGTLENGQINVGVQTLPADSPIGSLKGTGNLIAIYTKRYHEFPLIIQGPGAGRTVTAAGLLSDIQKISDSILR
ncbi:MAG TPA: bifunctional aspartate kinase/homoserine dehydrogenase I [Balneolales bacterium]|nr:bifunctional aspartate kinase/homoserine dehydrogenase I [Balneolales bacterium]